MDAISAGILDDVWIECVENVLTITAVVQDIELAHSTWTLKEGVPTLFESGGLESIDMEFPVDLMKVLFSACHKADAHDVTMAVKLIRPNPGTGSIEVSIRHLGIVYIAYQLVFRKSTTGLKIVRISAASNPSVKAKPVYKIP